MIELFSNFKDNKYTNGSLIINIYYIWRIYNKETNK